MGVTSVALGVGGGEDGVHEHEGADDLRSQARARAVPRGDRVRPASEAHVERTLERLHQARAADCAQALRHHVRQRARERDLPRQQQPERHRRVDVPTWKQTNHEKWVLAHVLTTFLTTSSL